MNRTGLLVTPPQVGSDASSGVDAAELAAGDHLAVAGVGGCLFDNVKTDMRIYREEIFGPALGIVRTPDLAGAVRMVNAHHYGNGVAIFTSDGGAARNFANGIDIGMVGVNVPIPVPMAFHSFGGWKQSLFGDHHIYGPEGVRFYTRYKAITQRCPTGARRGAEYVMPTLGR